MPKRQSSEISESDSENVDNVDNVAPLLTKGAPLAVMGSTPPPISTSTLPTVAPGRKYNWYSFTWSPEGGSGEVPEDIYTWITEHCSKYLIVREQASLTHIQGAFITKLYYGKDAVRLAWKRMKYAKPAMDVKCHSDILGAVGYCQGDILALKGWTMADLQLASNFHATRVRGKFYGEAIKTVRNRTNAEAWLMTSHIMSEENVDQETAEKNLQAYGNVWPACDFAGPYLQQVKARQRMTQVNKEELVH